MFTVSDHCDGAEYLMVMKSETVNAQFDLGPEDRWIFVVRCHSIAEARKQVDRDMPAALRGAAM